MTVISHKKKGTTLPLAIMNHTRLKLKCWATGRASGQ